MESGGFHPFAYVFGVVDFPTVTAFAFTVVVVPFFKQLSEGQACGLGLLACRFLFLFGLLLLFVVVGVNALFDQCLNLVTGLPRFGQCYVGGIRLFYNLNLCHSFECGI